MCVGCAAAGDAAGGSMACGIAAGNGAAAASDSPGAISAFLGRWGPVGTLGLVVGALAYAIL